MSNDWHQQIVVVPVKRSENDAHQGCHDDVRDAHGMRKSEYQRTDEDPKKDLLLSAIRHLTRQKLHQPASKEQLLAYTSR